MTALPVPDPIRLWDAVARPHEQARVALDDPAADSLAAVAWCSAHVATVERVLHPVVVRRLPRGRRRLRAAWAADHLLEQAVHRLDRRLTGDVHFSHEPVASLEQDVRTALATHEEVERDLVADLEPVLSEQQQRALVARLAEVLVSAPTRPHPSGSRAHRAWRVGFPMEAWVDHWRDRMDNRSVPGLLREPPARSAGRWAHYLAGVPPKR